MSDSTTSPAAEQDSYWQALAARLDAQIAKNLAPTMQRFLRDDLSERLPRTQAMHCKAGTVFDAASMQPKLDALRERLLATLMGTPHPQDVSNVTRARCPLYHQYITAERPEDKARVTAALKRQMVDIAATYTDYATRMLEQSFAQVNGQADFPTLRAENNRELVQAVETSLTRAYYCMEHLTPSVGDAIYGLTDNRIALMQAVDFMKDITEIAMREMIAKAPTKPAANMPAEPVRTAGRAVFTAHTPRTREQVLADRGIKPPLCR